MNALNNSKTKASKRKRREQSSSAAYNKNVNVANELPEEHSGSKMKVSKSKKKGKRKVEGAGSLMKAKKTKGETSNGSTALNLVEERTCCVGESCEDVPLDGSCKTLTESTPDSSNTDILHDWFSGLHYVYGTRRKQQLKALEAKGVTPNKGAWSTEEVNRLHDNLIKFLQSNDVRDFQRLIIPATLEDKKFRRDTDFGRKMCKGIKRTYTDINQRVMYQYSNFLTKGKLSDDEKKELINLRKQGKSWKEIGLTINRLHVGLSNFFVHHSKTWNQGHFTKEEDDLLRKAVSTLQASNGDDKGTWVQVSEIVGTRSPIICSNRWRRIVSKQENLMEEIIFTENDCQKLVSTMYDSNFEDEYLIDWDSLSGMFDKSVTPKWLRWKWGVLIKEIPYSQYLEFPEKVEKLYALYEMKHIETNGTDVEKIVECPGK